MSLEVVNKYKHKPTPDDLYIGRGSVLGNPYTSMKDKKTQAEFVCDTKEESIESYKTYLLSRVEEKDPKVTEILNYIWAKVKTGKDVKLVCFCHPKPCHGNVIKELIESKL